MIKKTIFIISLLIFLSLSLSFSLHFVYAERLYPGVRIAGLPLGGKSREEAFNILEKRLNYFKNQGIKITYGEREWVVKEEDTGLYFNLEKTLEEAFLVGHEKNLGKRLTSQILLLFTALDFPIKYNLDKNKLDQYLVSCFSFLEEKPVSSKLALKDNRFYIIPEKEGQEVNFNKLKADLKESLDNLQEKKIEVTLKKKLPILTRAGVLKAYQEAQEITSKPLKLKSEKKYWILNPPRLISWIDLKVSPNLVSLPNPTPLNIERGIFSNQTFGDFTQTNSLGSTSTQILETDLKQEEVISFLESIASEIEQEPKEARFKLEGDRVTLFEKGQEGRKIDISETTKRIKEALKNPTPTDTKEAEIVVETIVPKVGDQSIQDLKIQDLIGTGESDFTGSPANRRHNIKVGANRFNGVLIPPGEKLSIIQTLGEVSEKTGFKPELVIKPEGTIPEFGGGLCQISTTIFRAAIYSGLPILERKPHKYVVSYYKPIGMDATIYIPHPDVRFKNDTEGHILIQSRISGNKLYFDFYGTSDGREVEIQGPYYTSGWVNPGPAEYVETNTLKKDEKKQIEKEHRGVSTVFHRIVTRNGEEILKDSFYSKYQPWNAVFLVGPGSAPSQEEKKKEIAPTKKEAPEQEVTKKEIKTEEPKEEEEEE